MENVNSSFLDKHVALRAVTGITCSLSLLGSLVIIITFCLFPSLRTSSRQILVHLSLMDMGVALANLTGVIVYFDKYYYHNNHYYPNVSALHDGVCKAQAFLALYSTYGSILWTNSLAVYIYFTIVFYKSSYSKWVLRLAYIICYLLPFGMSIWLLLTHRLGFSPYGSGGWCTLIVVDPFTQHKDYFVTSFGYDMWIYLTVVLVPVLFIGSRSHITLKLARMSRFTAKSTMWAIHNVDYKFILIPLTFIFLRIWTCILAATLIYTSVLDSANYYGIKILIYLAAIGDSGQGIANAIIFVVFTKKVRDKLCLRKPAENDLFISKAETLNSSIHTPPNHSPYSSLINH